MSDKTIEFINKAKEVHDDKYDYSKVEYINNHTKIIIICKEHGEFKQSPSKHVSGQKCSKCSGKYKPTTIEFIKKLIHIHGKKYDYSNVNYTKGCNKINIICKEHGEFEQIASSHLSGNNCPKCVGGIKYDTNEFIRIAKLKHSDKYDYSKVNYINNHTNIIIICKEHGDFEQKPQNHLSNSGCSKCGIIIRGSQRKSTLDDFIEKAKLLHGDKYDYSKVIYNSAKDKVIIICKEHGDFLQSPDGHKAGKGCKKCATEINIINQSFTTNEFIEKANIKHGDKYDYSKVVYVNYTSKVIIICKKHGEFTQTPVLHLNGCGCPICVNKTEQILYEEIKFIYNSLQHNCRFEWCKNIDTNKFLPFDFCIEEYKLLIELDGLQHFKQVMNWKTPEEQLKNDKYKEICANENRYSIIRLLQEDVLYDKYDWKTELINNIEKIKTDNIIQNIYICKNNEYENFIN